MSILMVVEGGRKYVEQGTKKKNLWEHGNIGHTPPSHRPKIVDLFLLVEHFSVAYYRYCFAVCGNKSLSETTKGQDKHSSHVTSTTQPSLIEIAQKPTQQKDVIVIVGAQYQHRTERSSGIMFNTNNFIFVSLLTLLLNQVFNEQSSSLTNSEETVLGQILRNLNYIRIHVS